MMQQVRGPEFQLQTLRSGLRDMVMQLNHRQAMDTAWYVQSTLELCGRRYPLEPGLPPGTDLGSDDWWGLWLYHQRAVKEGLEEVDL